MPDPFSEPLLKIERAKHHITDLNGKLNAYLALNPFKLFITQYPEIAQRQFRIKTNPPIPPAFALVIGDAIHNLRSALDIMMFGLVSPHSKSIESISFPFCLKANSMESAITRRQIQLAGKRVCDAVRALKPYPTGNTDLYAVHELDICDKHRLIVPVARNAELSDHDFKKLEPDLIPRPPVGARIIFSGGDSNDPIIMRINITGINSADLEYLDEPAEIQPSFTVCFGKEQPLAHEPLIPTLMRLTSCVEGAVADVRGATL